MLPCPDCSSGVHASAVYCIALTVNHVVHECISFLWIVNAVLAYEFVAILCEGRVCSLCFLQVINSNPVFRPFSDIITAASYGTPNCSNQVICLALSARIQLSCLLRIIESKSITFVLKAECSKLDAVFTFLARLNICGIDSLLHVFDGIIYIVMRRIKPVKVIC